MLPIASKIGDIVGKMHSQNIIHGDLTTSNMLLCLPVNKQNPEIVMIDFGLGYIDNMAEDKGVDLYVLERALLSTHPNTERLFAEILKQYLAAYADDGVKDIITKFEDVRMRGRKRTMVG